MELGYSSSDNVVSDGDLDLALGLSSSKRKREEQVYGSKLRPTTTTGKLVELIPEIFKDNHLTVGGQVKAKGEVLLHQARGRSKAPNLTYRIESFGRICQNFDGRRKKWVHDMGFVRLLHLSSGMQLPRKLAYWLLSRVDPISKILISPNGKVFKLSQNQVHWVLGIPNSGKIVPLKKKVDGELSLKVERLINKYGQSWETKCSKYEGRVYTARGIHVNYQLMERLEGEWEVEEEIEFKTLFLLLSLHMVLCPTQSPRLSSDLIPALTCAEECDQYDWCSLIISKIFYSVKCFARRFYATGYAGGCGGCLLFIVVYYLDRLNRDPLRWSVFPRLSVWDMQQIAVAAKQDRLHANGDYGKLGMMDVAYGEKHHLESRDSDGPCSGTLYPVYASGSSVMQSKPRRRRKLSCGRES